MATYRFRNPESGVRVPGPDPGFMSATKRRKSLRPERWHEELDDEVIRTMFMKSNLIEELESKGIPFEEAVIQAEKEFGR